MYSSKLALQFSSSKFMYLPFWFVDKWFKPKVLRSQSQPGEPLPYQDSFIEYTSDGMSTDAKDIVACKYFPLLFTCHNIRNPEEIHTPRLDKRFEYQQLDEDVIRIYMIPWVVCCTMSVNWIHGIFTRYDW